jgi:formylmethanofuran dehydrogenase subunit E
MSTLNELLELSAARHHHLCPRQVMGVRIGMLASQLLGIDLPETDKRVYAFVETDGCTVDGISVATGCAPGRRNMQILDFGKIAATFVDTHTSAVMRIRPSPQARLTALEYMRFGLDRWHAYLRAYQEMETSQLLEAQAIELTVSMEAIISREEARAVCALCGEEIFNEREVQQAGRVVCRGCAGENYYKKAHPEVLVRDVLASCD